MGFSLLKLVKFSFVFFLLFATGFITPVNKDYQILSETNTAVEICQSFADTDRLVMDSLITIIKQSMAWFKTIKHLTGGVLLGGLPRLIVSPRSYPGPSADAAAERTETFDLCDGLVKAPANWTSVRRLRSTDRHCRHAPATWQARSDVAR